VNPSRAATDELLAGLRAGGWRPVAWARFAALTGRRSVQQAARHPQALAEVTILHGLLALAAGRPGRRWVAASWLMAATHLGLLEDRPSLGTANVITLLRANLPALGGPARWLPALALASDLADGQLARRAGTVSPFGEHADSLADAAFWTWYTLRHEPSRAIRCAALAAWTAPVLTLATASILHGQMTDPPRPAVLRPAAALQALIALRAARRPAAPMPAPGTRVPPATGLHSPDASRAQAPRRAGERHPGDRPVVRRGAVVAEDVAHGDACLVHGHVGVRADPGDVSDRPQAVGGPHPVIDQDGRGGGVQARGRGA